MISEEAKIIIENNPLFIGSASINASPNVTVVDGCKVVGKNKIIITDVYMTQCKENLCANPNCCLLVYSERENLGFKIFGKAEYQTEGNFLELAQKTLNTQGLKAKGAIIVSIDKIFKVE